MTDKTAEQLRACPFCGGAAMLNRRTESEQVGYNETYVISCRKCGASVRGMSKQDKNGWINDPKLEGLAETVAKWNTRADSGEAVAWLKVWKSGDGAELSRRVDLHPDNEPWLTHMKPIVTPLFTNQRAKAVDARYVTVKHPRFFNEEENNAWHCALPDVMVAFDAIAAIASREGEVS